MNRKQIIAVSAVVVLIASVALIWAGGRDATQTISQSSNEVVDETAETVETETAEPEETEVAEPVESEDNETDVSEALPETEEVIEEGISETSEETPDVGSSSSGTVPTTGIVNNVDMGSMIDQGWVPTTDTGMDEEFTFDPSQSEGLTGKIQ